MLQVVWPRSGGLQPGKDCFEQGYFGEEDCCERERTGVAGVVAWGDFLVSQGIDLRRRCWVVTGNGDDEGLWGGRAQSETGNVQIWG